MNVQQNMEGGCTCLAESLERRRLMRANARKS
jgi:hypothetical protein